MTIFSVQAVSLETQPHGGKSPGLHERTTLATSCEVEADAVDEACLSVAGEMLAVEVDGPAVRWDRIVRLRASIGAGTYRVSSVAIAEKMMDEMAR